MPLRKRFWLSWLALGLLSSCAHTRAFTPMGNCRWEGGEVVHCVDANGRDKDPAGNPILPPAEGLVFDLREFQRFNQECHL